MNDMVIGDNCSAANARLTLGGCGKPTAVCDKIEIIAHAQVSIVAGIEDATAAGPKERNTGQSRQIRGMNVVGEYVVVAHQDGIPAAETIDRQSVGRVDARSTKDYHAAAAANPEISQYAFGIDASLAPEA